MGRERERESDALRGTRKDNVPGRERIVLREEQRQEAAEWG